MSLLSKSHHNFDSHRKKPGLVVNKRHSRTIGPLQATRSDFQERTRGANPAAELIRRKINELYAKEPSAQQEQANTLANNGPAQYSKHQRFMYELSTSGKPLAQIQTEWHNYYINLSDNEKHEVWQEFYETNARQPSAYTQFVRSQAAQQPATTPPPHIPHKDRFAILRAPVFVSDHAPVQQATGQTAAGIKRQMLEEIKTYNRTQLKLHHHIQSLAFGLGLGVLVLFIFLFGFFNQIIIAPLIQPASTQSNTPIILSTSGVAPSSNPEVIIPKINVEIPVIYDETSVNDAAVETSLQDGVLHYPTTVFPGQLGNAAFFGHSSNNILNPGKYKFAFVLLHTLVPGDVFYLTYNDKVYAYQVYDRQIVNPGDVSVLNNVPGKIATATLITCDPPGTSINRLVVWGEQISPDPSTNASPAQTITPAEQPGQLANDGPSLWGRFTHWLTNLL